MKKKVRYLSMMIIVSAFCTFSIFINQVDDKSNTKMAADAKNEKEKVSNSKINNGDEFEDSWIRENNEVIDVNSNTILEEKNSNEEEIDILLGVPISKKIVLPIKQSIQENSYYCGPAVVQMLLGYKGFNLSQGDLAKKLNTHSITGTEYDDTAVVLNDYLFNKKEAMDYESGYHVQTIPLNSNSTDISKKFASRVVQNINDDYPILVAVDLHSLYPNLPSVNHFLIVIGYALSDESNVAFYYVIDPLSINQDATYGGLKIFTKDELLNAIVNNSEPAYLW